MAAYRFCRPDDIPLLVAAVNECYTVHFPDAEPWSVEGFRKRMKEIDVWPSNSMVAMAGDDPIAVLIGTKRSTEVLVLLIGVRQDHQRQGHALHIVTSLSQKLAVLGPERLVTEVPLDDGAAVALAEAAGYEAEVHYTDYARPAVPAAPVPDGLVVPATVEELDDAGLLDTVPAAAPWERDATSLRARTGLEAAALGTPMGLEAGLVWAPTNGGADVVALTARGAQAELFQELLLRHVAGRGGGELRLPKVFPGEVFPGVLQRLGFRAGRRWARYACTASPG